LDRIYQGNKPQDFMEGVRSVVIVAVAVPSGAIDPLPKGRPEYTNTLMAATVTLRAMGFKIARHLERKGYKASIVPNEGSEFGYWYADKKTLKATLGKMGRIQCWDGQLWAQPSPDHSRVRA
jgi:epoxyqueuosine reductase QueG